MRELHIQLTLGASFPGNPIDVRRKLIEAIEDEIGEVGDTGTGGGVMDIWLAAEEPQTAARRVRRIAKRLGISEWTEVTVRSRSLLVEILADDGFSVERAKAAADALIREINADSIRWGDVTGRGVTRGIVEVHIDVRDPAAALTRVEAIAKRLGISDRIRMEER